MPPGRKPTLALQMPHFAHGCSFHSLPKRKNFPTNANNRKKNFALSSQKLHLANRANEAQPSQSAKEMPFTGGAGTREGLGRGYPERGCLSLGSPVFYNHSFKNCNPLISGVLKIFQSPMSTFPENATNTSTNTVTQSTPRTALIFSVSSFKIDTCEKQSDLFSLSSAWLLEHRVSSPSSGCLQEAFSKKKVSDGVVQGFGPSSTPELSGQRPSSRAATAKRS